MLSTTLLLGLAASVLATPQYGDTNAASSTSGSMTSTASGSTSSASGVHSVKVGPGLTFTPDTVTAAQGDWVEFTFGEGHSVAQSSFGSPCQPMNGSSYFYSGFPGDGDVWRIQINSTSPLWLYCSATGHCEGGMAMVINQASTGNKTLAAYKSAAANAQGSSPATVQGGVFGAANSSNSGSGSGSGSSSTSGSGSSSTASSTGSASSSSSTGKSAGSSNTVKNGLMLAGAIAAGVAAVL
ncbi:hypothetical protein LTR10_021922 [Elasticomyces elasticus]|uniref:Phytocyanin domain-containing protein n=1 Tax=Exophiala sideris TaxID=1016849 RepID=A0ABR0IWL1_9EURO|nr:hypothetical protein LTR10_021922 [Elasticomyces elasticus]KAK5021846.1 hypothetical protein LTS07_010587 [Exophiala sideris]KAK5025911.1 hypothetical protein LTR13_010224 [Exophiala sideris]KAK5050276.1 hypothetical protein LTR69_010611 [Exophiala sideris]KAK5177119.1 hypothetical protein LTR44_010403 [Eurotiomycetes sp. CCFEE 6388]